MLELVGVGLSVVPDTSKSPNDAPPPPPPAVTVMVLPLAVICAPPAPKNFMVSPARTSMPDESSPTMLND